MPSLLGKRKSRTVDESSDAALDAQELLRRHFEARFKPLAVTPGAAPLKRPADSDDSQSDDHSESGTDLSESEWDGVSDDGDGDEDEDEEDDGTHMDLSTTCFQDPG